MGEGDDPRLVNLVYTADVEDHLVVTRAQQLIILSVHSRN